MNTALSSSSSFSSNCTYNPRALKQQINQNPRAFFASSYQSEIQQDSPILATKTSQESCEQNALLYESTFMINKETNILHLDFLTDLTL
jgi:hypothetical protein